MICAIDDCKEGYGNIKGDDAAHARYLSLKLSSYTMDCFFSDFDPKIVDMVDSYDESADEREPEYLPAKYPNVLINGSDGMAFGVATNIPFYNVRELLEYTIKLIHDPMYKGYLIPDTPTHCLIVDDEKVFRSINETGRGVFKMRGEISIDEERHSLMVQSIPYQVNHNKVVETIVTMKEEKILNGLIDIKDDSANETIDMELVFKKEINLAEMRDIIYKKTLLENYYPIQIKVINNLTLEHHSVRSLLLSWLQYRRNFKRRYYNMKIVHSKAREHVLDIILFLFNEDNAEKTIKIIKKSENDKEAVSKLMKEYDITSLRAEAIINMRAREYTKDSIKKYRKEKSDLVDNIEKFKKIIRGNRIDEEIIKELEEGIKKYGEPRRSKIIKLMDNDKIPNTNHILVFTKNGYVKKLNTGTKTIGSIESGDEPVDIITVNNRDELIIFDNLGRVHNISVNTIQGAELSSYGVTLDKYARIENGKIVSIFNKTNIGKEKDDSFFLFTSKNGIIKKTSCVNYMSLKNSSVGTMVKKSDELISVKCIKNDTDIIVFTLKGYGLRFNSTDISETKRMSLGVKALSFDDEDDRVGDTTIINHKDKYIMMVTSKGCVKKCLLSNLLTEGRRSESSKFITMDDNEYLNYMVSVGDKDIYRVFLKTETFDININNDVPEMYRLNKGKKLIPVKKGDMIIKIKKIN